MWRQIFRQHVLAMPLIRNHVRIDNLQTWKAVTENYDNIAFSLTCLVPVLVFLPATLTTVEKDGRFDPQTKYMSVGLAIAISVGLSAGFQFYPITFPALLCLYTKRIMSNESLSLVP